MFEILNLTSTKRGTSKAKRKSGTPRKKKKTNVEGRESKKGKEEKHWELTATPQTTGEASEPMKLQTKPRHTKERKDLKGWGRAG